jgi:hypothetical protein
MRMLHVNVTKSKLENNIILSTTTNERETEQYKFHAPLKDYSDVINSSCRRRAVAKVL